MKLTLQINGKKHELTAAEARKLRDDLNAFLGDIPQPIVINLPLVTIQPFAPISPYPFWEFQPETTCSSRS